MRALRCHRLDGPEALALDRIELPQPAPGEVRVRVAAAALNFPDLLITRGEYQVKPPLPFTPGMELAGIVDAVGADVQRIRPGDRVGAVTTWGAFAEAACVEQSRVVPLHPSIDFARGAALGLAYQTVWHGYRERARIAPGDKVLVLGAGGGIGLAAVQLARAAGAEVIAAASSADKLAVCRAQGAQHAVDYACENLVDAVRAIAGREGVDIVVDPVGGDIGESAQRCLGWRGRYLVIGFARGAPPRLAANRMLLAEQSVLGVYVGEAFRREPGARAERAAEIAAFVLAGAFSPVVSQVHAFEDHRAAFAALGSGRLVGKVVLDMVS